MSRQWTRSWLLAAWATCALARPSWACGPWFPVTILDGGDEALLWAPVADFRLEIGRVRPPSAPRFRALVPKDDPYSQTAEAGAADLRASLERSKVPQDKAEALVARYAAARKALRDYASARAEWERRKALGYEPKQNPAPPWPGVAVPAGLPEEFADYLRGAVAYHRGRRNAALRAWLAVLKRPEDQRRYRTTWAAFMVGRAALDREPEKAPEWFRYVRHLAGKGWRDSLGLAAASYGWEAMAALRRKDYPRAIELYLTHHAAGDPTAAMSLRTAAERLLKAGPEAMRRAAANPSARQVVTAYLVARGGPPQSTWDRPSQELTRGWLAAAEAAGAKDMDGADRLAWAAYQAGDMKAAERWLGRARPDSPVAGWIRAKLLLRAGRLDQAAAVLAKVARAFPKGETWTDVNYWFDYGASEYSPADSAAGELAALRLARSQYVDALDLLLRHDWWTDAAYVAERVLTADELVAYVDRHWPEKAARYDKDGAILHERGNEEFDPGEPDLPANVRYLLARRLTRVGQWKQARAYYPPRLRPRLDAYVRAIRAGHDARRSAAERAKSLWAAARIARAEGMQLLGAEVAPDWHRDGGQFENAGFAGARTSGEGMSLAAPTADERRRLGRHRLVPEKRFHYRYVAAEHAWSAAQLMPDEADQTARVLCEAGTWLKNRDPKAADRFYKALVRRCGTTRLGREADQLRWFPQLDSR